MLKHKSKTNLITNKFFKFLIVINSKNANQKSRSDLLSVASAVNEKTQLCWKIKYVLC